MNILRKYGVATTINFDLFEVDGINFRVNAVHGTGDTAIMKDEGAEANTTSGFVDEGTGYSLALSATEMQAARIVVYIVDQTATKVWLDKSIVIDTYGHASAQHAFDLDHAQDTPVKNTALNNIPFFMALDSGAKGTGLTVSGVKSLDGGTNAAVAGTIAEIGDGMYSFDATAADMNGDSVLFTFTATGAKPSGVAFSTRS